MSFTGRTFRWRCSCSADLRPRRLPRACPPPLRAAAHAKGSSSPAAAVRVACPNAFPPFFRPPPPPFRVLCGRPGAVCFTVPVCIDPSDGSPQLAPADHWSAAVVGAPGRRTVTAVATAPSVLGCHAVSAVYLGTTGAMLHLVVAGDVAASALLPAPATAVCVDGAWVAGFMSRRPCPLSPDVSPCVQCVQLSSVFRYGVCCLAGPRIVCGGTRRGCGLLYCLHHLASRTCSRSGVIGPCVCGPCLALFLPLVVAARLAALVKCLWWWHSVDTAQLSTTGIH